MYVRSLASSRSKFLVRWIGPLALLVMLAVSLWPQRELAGSARVRLALDRLNVCASVLMIAAHPDDENTALLAYLARGRHVRTGYLSLTRGEGGQNLIGPEQGDELGLIRTQELLAARKIDGAEQFFTRAIDFGFTKTPEETFQKWGHDKILSDVVWVIRRFRPDVIVLRFTGTPRDGHGQHQVSAILGKEAYDAAADPKRFPEQLKWVGPWHAKRLMQNSFYSEEELAKVADKIALDTGQYDPVLGVSYNEIAGMSRSQHRSQGMGAPERKGTAVTYLVPLAGDTARKDIFDGIDTTWNRVQGGASVGKALSEAVRGFDPEHPEKIAPDLLNARKALAPLRDPTAAAKLRDLDEAIAMCTGLWLDASADKFAAVPGGSFKLNATAVARMHTIARVDAVEVDGLVQASAEVKDGALPFNEAKSFPVEVGVPANAPLSQPYWLRLPKQGDTYNVPDQTEIGMAENPPILAAHFRLREPISEIEIVRPVVFRYIERAQGELTRPIFIEPPVSLRWSEPTLLFPDAAAKSVALQVTSNVGSAAGALSIQAPDGWAAAPASQDFHLTGEGQAATLPVRLTPSSGDARVDATAAVKIGDQKVAVDMHAILYPHIQPQVWFPPARSLLVRADVKLLAKNIGYVMGAGDEVPEALRQMGASVTFLGPDDLAHGDLSQFDAIVTGVRAYNVRADLRANRDRLMAFMNDGGTLVVQYNVPDTGPGRGGPPPPANAAGRGPGAPPPPAGTLARIGPYPLTVGGERVTVEDSPVGLPDPKLALLHKPNEITPKDFEGWIQERGLNFASDWDSHYQPPFETHDPGEKPQLGSTLYARYGKGAYVFTAISWFRELPAGVPGAFRIFANLLSAGKTL